MKNTAGIITAFLGGALVGAAIGLLLAPESGEETRMKMVVELEKLGIKLPKTEDDEPATETKPEV